MNSKSPGLGACRLLISLSAAVLAAGCIWPSPAGEPETNTPATVQPILQSDTALLTASSLPQQSSTLPAAIADKRVVCLEARANRSIYERCKKAASGDLSLPRSELRRCAGIQRNAGAYSDSFHRGLQACVGIPADGMADDALFCKDLEQPDRDECYLSVRMCGPIEDQDARSECESGLELNAL